MSGSPLALSEIYDPAGSSWRASGSFAAGRTYHAATLLANGKLLVTGGLNSGVLGSAELGW
jgi:hypothetical protein